MGGSSIFRLKADDPNVSVIIETLTEHGTQQDDGAESTCRKSRTATSASC